MRKLTKNLFATLCAVMSVTGICSADITNVDTNLGGGNGAAYIDNTSGGNATHTPGPNSATLNFSGNSHVTWDRLNLLPGETLNFNANAGYNNLTILNTVSNSVSNLYGNITTNAGIGKLIISNPNGILFDGANITSAGDVILTTQSGLTLDASAGDLILNKTTLTPVATQGVTIQNGSIIDCGGKNFIIAAPNIDIQDSSFNNLGTMHLVTNDGYNYLFYGQTSPTTSINIGTSKAVEINGDVYINDNTDIASIRNNTDNIAIENTRINGDLHVREDGGSLGIAGSEEINGDVIINKNSGNVTINDYTLSGNTTISAGGDVTLGNNTLGSGGTNGNLEITSGGSIALEDNSSSGYLNINSTGSGKTISLSKGTQNIGNSFVGNSSITTTDGNIDVKYLTLTQGASDNGDLTINTKDGEIIIENSSLDGQLLAKTNTGNVTIDK